jgi:hypothetical protein
MLIDVSGCLKGDTLEAEAAIRNLLEAEKAFAIAGAQRLDLMEDFCHSAGQDRNDLGVECFSLALIRLLSGLCEDQRRA